MIPSSIDAVGLPNARLLAVAALTAAVLLLAVPVMTSAFAEENHEQEEDGVQQTNNCEQDFGDGDGNINAGNNQACTNTNVNTGDFGSVAIFT